MFQLDAACTRLAPVIRAGSRRVQIHHRDVGVHEIVSLEEERLSRRDREGVRKAVAVIQACAMASLSEAAECAARQFALFRVDWHELDARATEQMIEVSQPFGSRSRATRRRRRECPAADQGPRGERSGRARAAGCFAASRPLPIELRIRVICPPRCERRWP